MSYRWAALLWHPGALYVSCLLAALSNRCQFCSNQRMLNILATCLVNIRSAEVHAMSLRKRKCALSAAEYPEH